MTFNRISGIAFLAPALLLAPQYSHAAEDEAELERVVVTATRTEQSLDDSLASVSVITAADIDRLQARNLIDLLEGQAGITVANSGGPGKLTSVFMRGTSSDHVLVLVNGMRFGSTTAGIAALQDIPVDQVERIEIVRGPRAALYGSDAIGGVIQVFTRQPETGLAANAEVGAGSFGRREASVGIGERFEKSWYRVDAGHVTLDGFDSCVNSGTAGCFANEPDDDGYDNTSVSGRVGRELGETGIIEFDAWQAEGENFYDGFFNRTEYERSAMNLRISGEVMDALDLEFRGGRSSDDSVNSGPFGSGYVDTARDEASLLANYSLESQVISLGIESRDDQVDSDTAYDETSRRTDAVFTQWQFDASDWSADVAARYIDDEQFGGKTTGSFGLGHDISDNWKAWLSYGSAYHAPTFNDLYFPGFSNPDLEPETSHSTEIGLRYDNGYQLDVNLYENRLDNLIEFDFATSMPVNVSEARIRGLEVRWLWRNSDWRISADMTLLDTENLSGLNEGNELPRRADRSLRLEIDRSLGEWSLGAGLNAVGRRYDDLGNTTELAGYATLDLRASWMLSTKWELAAKLGNALDRDYQTVNGYFQAGRNGQLYLRYNY